MAGKQLGKLRQWATEAISTSSKTTVTDEFRELEHDIELRREGIQRLTIASRDYHHSLVRKKESLAAGETEKLLPLDAQGIVMIQHGEEFGEESAYGTSLVRFGRAQCKIATLQEAMGLTFHDTFIRALARYEDEIGDYQSQRKKLESRRLSYDAAMSKVEILRKNKKAKDREVEEAEDELARAKMRYDEASEDVHTRMYAIQENELDQLRDLTTFLDLELNFFAQALELLQEVKNAWTDESHISRPNRPRPTGPSHNFVRSAEDVMRTPRMGTDASDSDDHTNDRDGGNGTIRPRASRKGSSFSLSGRKSSTRRRADSATTERGNGDSENDGRESEREKEKEKKEKGDKRRSIAGWSMSWGKSSGKSKDKFANLKGGRESDEEASDDDETRSHRSARSTRSAPASATKSPKIRASKSPAPVPPLSRSSSKRREIASASPKIGKRVVAMHDYTARADDELGFTSGQEIAVINEVSDDWWMGSLGGKSGLFPVAYVRALTPKSGTQTIPMLPARPPAASTTLKDEDDGYAGDTSRFHSRSSAPGAGAASESEDSDHPFGDHYLIAPRVADVGYGYAGMPNSPGFDADSMISAVSDVESMDEERPVLARRERSPSPDAWDRERERERKEREARNGSGRTTPSSWRATPILQQGGPPVLPARAPSVKKAPPPPPPRRPSSTMMTLSSASASGSSVNVGAGTPPIPARPNMSRSGSSVGKAQGQGLGASVGRRTEVTESPFD